MISHDTGKYLGTYGYKVATPVLDGLADRGLKFTNYFCPAPQCSPSRGSILTGLYPHNNGLMGLAHKEFSINGEVTTLPKELTKAGYETSLIGFSHETIGAEEPGVVSSTTKLGYERYEKVEGNFAPDVASRVEALLEEKSKNKEDKPFFMNIGFEETHRPFDRYEPYMDDLDEIEVVPYLPDTKQVRQDLSLFQGSVKVLDEAVGRIIRKLEETGLDENTIIIYTTDHGIAFPRAKGTLKEAGLETALIIYAPKLIEGGKVIDQLLCNVDMMPTILDLAGGQIPENLDGKSFAVILKNENKPIRNEFFCELTWHDRYHPMRGIRTDKYKYVLNIEDGPKIYMPFDIHSSLSGEDLREEYYIPNEKEELYDLTKDPLENENLINHPDYRDIADELREKVKNWLVETKDPILQGPISGVPSTKWAEEERLGRAYKGRNAN